MTDTMLALPGHVQATKTGLIFSNGISYEDWEAVGDKLKSINAAVQWWIGDWLNYGENKWGEMYANAIEETDYKGGTLRNYKYVAGRIELSHRCDNLSWSTHREVAALDKKSQIKLLQAASKKGWNMDTMRQAVKDYKKAISLPTPAEGLQPRLYVGRAENMDFLTAESVDIIVTSPPYNLGADDWPMGGNDNMASGLEGRTSRDGIGYNDVLPEQDYQDWQVDCLAEWFRVAKWGGSLFYNHKVRQRKGEIVHPMDWLRKTEWTIRQEIIWTGVAHTITPRHCFGLTMREFTG